MLSLESSGATPKHPSQLVWGFSPKQLSFDPFQRCLLYYGQTALPLTHMSRVRYFKRLICSIIMLIAIPNPTSLTNLWFGHRGWQISTGQICALSFWAYTHTLWDQQLQKQLMDHVFLWDFFFFFIKQSILELNLLL